MTTGVTEYYLRLNSKIYSDNDLKLTTFRPNGLYPRTAKL
jgi:hypothetical protein